MEGMKISIFDNSVGDGNFNMTNEKISNFFNCQINIYI